MTSEGDLLQDYRDEVINTQFNVPEVLAVSLGSPVLMVNDAGMLLGSALGIRLFHHKSAPFSSPNLPYNALTYCTC